MNGWNIENYINLSANKVDVYVIGGIGKRIVLIQRIREKSNLLQPDWVRLGKEEGRKALRVEFRKIMIMIKRKKERRRSCN